MDTEYISSPLFTFIVGEERKKFPVHSQALADLSPTLDKLLDGQMLEANVRQADWSDVEVDTFVRLCEYAYRSDYTPPSCTDRTLQTEDFGIVPEPSKSLARAARPKKWNKRGITDLPSLESSESYSRKSAIDKQGQNLSTSGVSARHTLQYKKKNISSEQLDGEFVRLIGAIRFNQQVASNTQEMRFSPKGNTNSQEDFTPVFLSHVKLYILADKYGIFPLGKLVLQKLTDTLMQFSLYEGNVDNVTGLVRFAFNKTFRRQEGKDSLRHLATAYVASVLVQLGDSTAFQELLAESGDFVTDLWEIIWT
ncbi:uncharacterized protein BO97DRAFT_414996 [Aspergillus homomorphus CBS 101889]|uniref:BTB domain-containing protein n=1 Tax=Aspergillus homomorphus (strain CBS 101889) TaxID=1450537 RepID=A0A395HZP5_ASPHC|nr:hypothetical protein BO97DRAFT_414996 [Aspergillus homomorphus CBS 101889]RAL11744.1 hypothetical protein BO97DRAFT_414996 [Aspergillus homomorphus CBS 101889]